MTRYTLILGTVVVLFAALLLATPAPVSWTPDYRHTSNAPLGTAVLHGLLGAWTGAPVEVVAQTPYLRLADTTAADDGALYVFITEDFAPDPSETARLLAFARRGGTVFAAAESFDGDFPEALGAPDSDAGDASPTPVSTLPIVGAHGDSLLRLDAPAMQRVDGYGFPVAVRAHILTHLDTARTARLGRDAEGSPTLVRVAVGRGAVVLSSTPRAFSNAALTATSLTGDGDAAAYIGGVLGHLPARRVLWDAHHKPIGTSRSPLGLVFATPPLRWAYTLLLLGALLFVGFRGRRWQRVVPVVAPPVNALAGFAESVGQLYAQHGNRAALVARRQAVFFDRLRTRAGIAAPDLSPETEAQAVRALGASADLADVFAALRRTGAGTRSNADLLALDRALDRVYAILGR